MDRPKILITEASNNDDAQKSSIPKDSVSTEQKEIKQSSNIDNNENVFEFPENLKSFQFDPISKNLDYFVNNEMYISGYDGSERINIENFNEFIKQCS